jgi:hypothetical protein
MLDIETIRNLIDGRRAVVIPSPKRREERGKNFVLKTAPLLAAKAIPEADAAE